MLPQKPEILSPAGNFEKLKAALLFGADAVYFAGKNFGMRAAADNFTLGEIEAACAYTHGLNKKLYLTVNAIPKSADINSLKTYLNEIKNLSARPDAVICADIGVVALVKKILPGTDIHISTQANVQNYLACLAWAELGASRIILSRELSFEDIKTIKSNIGDKIELECFVHGAMCVSYSGRCLLSNYYVSRDANKGACAQPCRWKYHVHYVTEEQRPGEYLEIAEDAAGAYLFSSKDLCMIGHIKDLVMSGVGAFKIEGRMKSAYYAACITNAYRIALDNYFGDNLDLTQKLIEETQSVSRREYDTGFFYGPPHADAKICGDPEYIREKIYLGTCVAYDKSKATAVFEQKNKIWLNQKAQILSPGRFGRDIIISNLLDENDEPIESAPHPSMIFKIRIDGDIKPGDILRSV